MNIGTILQTIIATVLIYLILSLLASEIQENIAALSQLRAKRLRQSIQQMFGESKDNEPLTQLLYSHPNIKSLNQSAFRWLSIVGFSFDVNKNFASMVLFALFLLPVSINFIYQKWDLAIPFLVVYIVLAIATILFENRCPEECRESIGPSYISDPEIFSSTIVSVIKSSTSITTQETLNDGMKALLDIVVTPPNPLPPAKNNPEDPAALVFLNRVAFDSNYNLDEFSKKLKALFNEAQERSSGVFKRNAKGLSLIIGLLLAVSTNADFFNIINRLSRNNQNFSSQLLERIEKTPSTILTQKPQVATEPKAVSDDLLTAQKEEILKLFTSEDILPLGWYLDERSYNKNTDKLLTILSNNSCNGSNNQISQCIGELFGALEEFSYIKPDFEKQFSLTDKKPYEDFKNKSQGLIKYNSIEFFEAYTEIFDELTMQKRLAPTGENKDRDTAINLFDDIKTNCLEKPDKKKSQCLRKIKDNNSVINFINGNFKNLNFETKIDNHINHMKESESFTKKLKQIHQDLSAQKLKSQQKTIDTNPLPIIFFFNNIDKQGGIWKVLFGWLISGIAISMGAPFWFDILGRVMNVRNAGASITEQKK
jgi:hypothetical protein